MRAFAYSLYEINPLRSVSKRWKSVRHAARKPHSPQNSSYPIVPRPLLSNILIISRTVSLSKAVYSSFFSALDSSAWLSRPRACVSTARNNGQSDGSGVPAGGRGECGR